jgi:hypothetical protein
LTYKQASVAVDPHGYAPVSAAGAPGQGKRRRADAQSEERIGVARLSRPEACLAVQGKGFAGQARGPDFKGRLRYMDVDRWKPVPVRDHPYERDRLQPVRHASVRSGMPST